MLMTYLGHHTFEVRKGLTLGVALFIVSEIFVFLSVFWAYFHSSLAPTIELGSSWPIKLNLLKYSIKIFRSLGLVTLNDKAYNVVLGFAFYIYKFEQPIEEPISSIKGSIEVLVGISVERWSNLKWILILSLRERFRVSDLSARVSYFYSEMPIGFYKVTVIHYRRCHQWAFLYLLRRGDLYFWFINSINWLNLMFLGVYNLPCTRETILLIPSISPIM